MVDVINRPDGAEGNMIRSIQLPANGNNVSGEFSRWPDMKRFARIVETAFAGVTVLPSASVFVACIRATGKNLTRAVELSVIDDDAGHTTYRVRDTAYRVDAVTGETDEIELSDGD